MSNKLFRLFYSIFFIPGFLTGISLKTGVDVSETGIASKILQAFCKILNFSPACELSQIFGLIGILTLVTPFVVVGVKKGFSGFISGCLFFLAGVFFGLFPNSSTFGMVLLLLAFLTLIIGLTEKSGESYGGVV